MRREWINYIKEICRTYNLHLKKRWGQHFLIDEFALERILKVASLQAGDRVLEIGPGLGILTRALAKKVSQVIAVEVDPQLSFILREEMKSFPHVQIIEGDILKLNFGQFLESLFGQSWKVVANIPYYISSRLIIKLLIEGRFFDSFVFTIQKEVAERIISQAGVKAYGILSVIVQYYSFPWIEGIIPRDCFYPQPKVDSCILSIKLKPEPSNFKDQKLFLRIVKAAFQQRRKTLFNNLKHLPFLEEESLLLGLKYLKIDKDRRTETLEVEDFVRLTKWIEDYLSS